MLGREMVKFVPILILQLLKCTIIQERSVYLEAEIGCRFFTTLVIIFFILVGKRISSDALQVPPSSIDASHLLRCAFYFKN